MLQRTICDFGMDSSFGAASRKLKEHYKIDICIETIRKVTERHAKRATEFNQKNIKKAKIKAIDMIAETDGSMVPIVESNKIEKDKRKNKKLSWKEFRLATVQKKGDVDWLYTISAESVDKLGEGLEKISIRCGFCDKTKVHAIGDGAKWIYDQMDKIFGCQMNYTIDFFHLCEYLSNAAEGVIKDKKEWMKDKKASLKKGEKEEILLELKNYQKQKKDHKGLKDCIRYIENRKSQFAYDKAIDKGLPIGSGKIESSHRNIIQERIKIPGAWWKISSAENIINLRILRENRDWEKFWKKEVSQRRVA